MALASPAWADTATIESAVKATYLYKLAPFVSWPADALANGAPIVICVQGAPAFDRLVDHAAAGQRVGTHPIAVREVSRLDRASGCHIAYVAGSPAQSTAEALSAVNGAPILTVTDSQRGTAKGVVHLELIGGRVRFAVNAALAGTDRLAISSKLLALAASVTR